jgi:hypothetical protein
MRGAETSFDRFTLDPGPQERRWMREHYWRMRTYAPYFDSRLGWSPRAWTYKDAYAIYPGRRHDSSALRFVLRDESGRRLFIPWGCSGGRCPQWAGDIGDPAFRAAWIAEARAQLAAGYTGLYIDDVNMLLQVSDGHGRPAVPIDPRTDEPMRLEDWQRYMARFMEQIRAAFPDEEIVHNVIWFAGDDGPYIPRQLRAADYIALERGVNDPGITGGYEPFGFRTFLDYVSRRHADGGAVIYDTRPRAPRDRVYGLATYLLTSSGRDAIGADDGGTPADWWRGYDLDLGEAKGPRRLVDGIWRRDFDRGTVLVNEPQAPGQTIRLGPGFRRLDGGRATTVYLGPATGTILLRARAPYGNGAG